MNSSPTKFQFDIHIRKVANVYGLLIRRHTHAIACLNTILSFNSRFQVGLNKNLFTIFFYRCKIGRLQQHATMKWYVARSLCLRLPRWYRFSAVKSFHLKRTHQKRANLPSFNTNISFLRLCCVLYFILTFLNVCIISDAFDFIHLEWMCVEKCWWSSIYSSFNFNFNLKTDWHDYQIFGYFDVLVSLVMRLKSAMTIFMFCLPA